MHVKTVVVLLVSGFEETEAIALIDVLRRAELAVVVAGLDPGPVTGSHDITVIPDGCITELELETVDMIVLPGGMPGARHLHDDRRVQEILGMMKARGRFTVAICAAPWALVPSGITEGRTVTSHPSVEKLMTGTSYVQDRVVVDGPVITSRGPGTALELAVTLVAILAGKEKAAELEAAMLISRPEPAREIPVRAQPPAGS